MEPRTVNNELLQLVEFVLKELFEIAESLTEFNGLEANEVLRLHAQVQLEYNKFFSDKTNSSELKSILLSDLNDACRLLLFYKPGIWEENNDFARNYKFVFFALTQDEVKKVGGIYPFQQSTNNSNLLIDYVDGKYQLVRSSPDFENLALEGGGVKGIAYCGMGRALAEKRMMPKIKRIAGLLS